VPEPSRKTGESGVLATTDRSTLRRKKERGSYDREVINAILDEGLLCHAGFSVEGSTFVIPMAYARMQYTLYLPGATGNRMLRFLAEGADVCVTVTLLDALVLARSAFHHSMNFRSVMLFGTTSRVDDDNEKQQAMVALLEHIASGRSADARPPSAEELRAALMIRVPIAEGSAKIRTGGPIDEPEDLEERIWAGQIPLSITAGAAISDGVLPAGTADPAYVRSYPARTAAPAVAASTHARGGRAEPGG
jgi:nitroimidazol reductase NimA-like FMN-containing flavoprotein (pyridoxamine 5'-phosphate oxidase superfamily)